MIRLGTTMQWRIKSAIRHLQAERPGLEIRAAVHSEYDEDCCSETGVRWELVLAAVRIFPKGDPLAVESVVIGCADEDIAGKALEYAQDQQAGLETGFRSDF